MSFEVIVYQNRTAEFDGQLTQKDGTPYILGEFDKLRLKIGRCGDPPFLDVLSDSPTPAGSFIEITSRGSNGDPPATPAAAARYLVRIAQDDVVTPVPGTYGAEITVIEADTGLADLGEQGVIDLVGTLGGAISYT